MGQQQLLLLVLGIVIVGLAVVVGIQAFSENQKKANADALVNDAIRLASDSQAWMLKPEAFGGGGNKGDWQLLTFQNLGYELGGGGSCAATEYGNLNGCFTLAPTAANVTITATSAENGNQVTVLVEGTKPEDITTTVDTGYAAP
jgi:hypothetical protein